MLEDYPMRMHLKLHGLDEVTIWRNETPIEPFLSRNILRKELQALCPHLYSNAHELVIEIKQPRGPRCLYGLLGAQIRHAENSSLNLCVGDGQLDSRAFEGSMISVIETPRYGLPEEVAEHVLQTIEDEMREQHISFGGILDICYGAYGEVSSSISVFKTLAKALPRILSSDALDGDLIMQIFNR